MKIDNSFFFFKQIFNLFVIDSKEIILIRYLDLGIK